MPEILVIGYGNSLRGDDAIGLRAARELERQFSHDPEIAVIACQQLAPELADDVARSTVVIFIDASLGDKPGQILCRPILPHNGPVGFTHHLSPESLLGAAEQLYGEIPKAYAITLCGWAFELSNKLSRGAQLRLPEMLRTARKIIADHRMQPELTGSTVFHR